MLPPPQTEREHRGYYDPDEVSDEAKHSALDAWASSRTLEACLQAAPRSLHARPPAPAQGPAALRRRGCERRSVAAGLPLLQSCCKLCMLMLSLWSCTAEDAL